MAQGATYKQLGPKDQPFVIFMGPFVNGIASGWLLGRIVYMWFIGLFDYMGQHLRIVLVVPMCAHSERSMVTDLLFGIVLKIASELL